MLSIYQLGALSEEGEEGRQHVDDLVIGEEARLLSERERMERVMSEAIEKAFSKGVEQAQETASATAELAAEDELARAKQNEEKLATLRSNFVQTKLKNAIRLKKMQKQTALLTNELAQADAVSATLKAEVEAFEWQVHGGDGRPLYQQGVVGPSAPPVQGPPTMTLPIGDVRNFYYELGDAGTDMENLASELRIAIEADVAQQVADKVAEEMKVFQEEAKKNAKSKKFDSVVATAIIQMLKSENEGHKLRLEGERKVLEEVKAAREDLQASLAQSTAQVEAEKTRADQAEEANKAAAVALEEAKRASVAALEEANNAANAKMEALEQQTRQAQEQQSGASQKQLEEMQAELDKQFEMQQKALSKSLYLEQRLEQAEASREASEAANAEAAATAERKDEEIQALQTALAEAKSKVAAHGDEAEQHARAVESALADAESNALAAKCFVAILVKELVDLELKADAGEAAMQQKAEAEMAAMEDLRMQITAAETSKTLLRTEAEAERGRAKAAELALGEAKEAAATALEEAKNAWAAETSTVMEEAKKIAAAELEDAKKIAAAELEEAKQAAAAAASEAVAAALAEASAAARMKADGIEQSLEAARRKIEDLRAERDRLKKQLASRPKESSTNGANAVRGEEVSVTVDPATPSDAYEQQLLDEHSRTKNDLSIRIDMLDQKLQRRDKTISIQKQQLEKASAMNGALEARVELLRLDVERMQEAAAASVPVCESCRNRENAKDNELKRIEPGGLQHTGKEVSPSAQLAPARGQEGEKEASPSTRRGSKRVPKERSRGPSPSFPSTLEPDQTRGVAPGDERSQTRLSPNVEAMRARKAAAAARKSAAISQATASETTANETTANETTADCAVHSPSNGFAQISATSMLPSDEAYAANKVHEMELEMARMRAEMESIAAAAAEKEADAAEAEAARAVSRAASRAEAEAMKENLARMQAEHAEAVVAIAAKAAAFAVEKHLTNGRDDSAVPMETALAKSGAVGQSNSHQVIDVEAEATVQGALTSAAQVETEKPAVIASLQPELNVQAMASSPTATAPPPSSSTDPSAELPMPAFTEPVSGSGPAPIDRTALASAEQGVFRSDLRVHVETIPDVTDLAVKHEPEAFPAEQYPPGRSSQALAHARPSVNKGKDATSTGVKRSNTLSSRAGMKASASSVPIAEDAWMIELDRELQQSLEANASLLQNNATLRDEVDSLRSTVDVLQKRLADPRRMHVPSQDIGQELPTDTASERQHAHRSLDSLRGSPIAHRPLDGVRGSPSASFERMLQARYQMALYQQAKYGNVDLSRVEVPIMETIPAGLESCSRVRKPIDRIELAHQMHLQRRSTFEAKSMEPASAPAAASAFIPFTEEPPGTPEDGGHEEACKRFMARLRMMRIVRAWLERRRAKLAAPPPSRASEVHPSWAVEKAPADDLLSKDLRIGVDPTTLPARTGAAPTVLGRPPLPSRKSRSLAHSASLPALAAQPSSPPELPIRMSNAGHGGVAVSTLMFQQESPPLPSMLLPPPKPRWKPVSPKPTSNEAASRKLAGTSEFGASSLLEHTADTFPKAVTRIGPSPPQPDLSPVVQQYGNRLSGSGRMQLTKAPTRDNA